MRIIRKAKACEAFGKFRGMGWKVIVHDGYDNMAMGILPDGGVYKTKAAAEAAAKEMVGRKFSKGKVI